MRGLSGCSFRRSSDLQAGAAGLIGSRMEPDLSDDDSWASRCAPARLLAVLVLLAWTQAAAAQATFVIDSTRSGMRVDATVNTPFGSDSDSDSTLLAGFLSIDVDEGRLHILDGTLWFADSLDFRFRYGNPSVGSIIAETDPDSLSLQLVIPGSPAGIEDGVFVQPENILLFEAILKLRGTGIFVSNVPDDPQDVAVGSTEDFAGRLDEENGTFHLTLPLRFDGGFNLGGGGDGDVTLEGVVYASAPVASPTEDPDELPMTLAVTSVYPVPARDRAVVVVANPSPQPVHLEVFDVRGRRVARGERHFLEPGRREVDLDTSGLSSGLYMVVVSAGGVRESVAVVVVR